MNNNSHSDSYAASGVDITAGYKAVELMKEHIAKTVLRNDNQIGGFGGLFPLDLKDTPNPVLVAGTDGVGTKLKLAFLMNKHDTVGIDCVAMCVNDIVCCGAKPLFFLDYIACGKNYPEKIADIVKNIDGSSCNIALEGRLDTTTAPQLEAELKSSLNGIDDLVFWFDDTYVYVGFGSYELEMGTSFGVISMEY